MDTDGFHYIPLYYSFVGVMPADAKPIFYSDILNSIHKNYNIPSDNGTHSITVKSQTTTKVSKVSYST